MARYSIPLGGISTSSKYEEGETCSLVNLRSKNGALHPVPPRKVLQQLSQNYNLLFVHQGNNYENWIGVIADTVYWDVLDGNPGVIAQASGNINSIEQIGNTLSLITNDAVFYLYFNNGQYRFLGELPQCPTLGFKTSDEMAHTEIYYSNEYGSGTTTADNFLEATKGLVNKAMDIMVNGGIDDLGDPIPAQGLQLFDACFVRYALRLYDGTLVKHSPPILVMPTKNILDLKKSYYRFDGPLSDQSKVDVYGYRIETWFDLTSLAGWDDIIKSVDVFMSAPLGISQVDNIKDLPTSSTGQDFRTYRLIEKVPPEAMSTIENTGNFYFIKSFEAGTQQDMSTPYAFPSEESDISSLENLIQQEVMSDDNFTNHKYGSQLSYAYNNRLHLAGIKTTFFNGYSPDYFLWFNTKATPGPFDGNYNGRDYDDAEGPLWDALMIEVEINTGLSTERVYQSTASYFAVYKLFMSAFLSYPDPRAKRLTLYRYSAGSWHKVFSKNLKEHNFLNLAYCLNDNLAPFRDDDTAPVVSLPDTSGSVSLWEGNKIKVSELSNPLLFPARNTYQAGGGDIVAMATNSMNVADRNYGQYPLYIFTTQGIWTLNIGSGEVVYSVLSAPTYPEAPTTGIVCPTPFGVAFTGPRGLMMINGQEVELISPKLEQTPNPLSLEWPEAVVGVVHEPYAHDFAKYLSGLDSIAYNPRESELIISDKESALCFVLNIPSKSFYRSTEKIGLIVKNTPSKLMAIDGLKLKDFAQAEAEAAHVSLITRPLYFKEEGIKKLDRMILRATLHNLNTPAAGKSAVIMIHHTNDNRNFVGLRGTQLKPNNLKDVDMGLMASAKARSFVFSFGALIDSPSEITAIEALANPEYNDSKMK